MTNFAVNQLCCNATQLNTICALLFSLLTNIYWFFFFYLHYLLSIRTYGNIWAWKSQVDIWWRTRKITVTFEGKHLKSSQAGQHEYVTILIELIFLSPTTRCHFSWFWPWNVTFHENFHVTVKQTFYTHWKKRFNFWWPLTRKTTLLRGNHEFKVHAYNPLFLSAPLGSL